MRRFGILALVCAVAASLCFVLGGCDAFNNQGYSPTLKDAVVQSPTIGEDGTLRVGVNANSYPLAGQPEGASGIEGINVDYAAAIADEMGLKLQIVDVGTDPEGALKDNKVDIVMGINSTDDVKFWKSNPYIPTSIAVFANSDNQGDFTVNDDTKIAAQVSSKSAYAVDHEYDQNNLQSVSDLNSAFTAMRDGQVQYVAADAVIGSYASHSGGYDTHIVGLLQETGGYCIGVNSSNTALQKAVSDAITSCNDSGVFSVIQNQWLGTVLDLTSVKLGSGATDLKASDLKGTV
ncbi:MAG: substrate-binding periplasmic protein, partial [Eggerthellaceae bacterium]